MPEIEILRKQLAAVASLDDAASDNNELVHTYIYFFTTLNPNFFIKATKLQRYLVKFKSKTLQLKFIFSNVSI